MPKVIVSIPLHLPRMKNLRVQNSYAGILQIALPISVAILIPQLSILTNTAFLGYYQPASGIEPQTLLAASGVAGIFYLTLVMIGYGLVSGILMMMSRKAGENDHAGLAYIFRNGWILTVALGLVLLILSQGFAPWLFRHFIHEEATRKAAIQFIRIRSWGLPFIMISQFSNSLFLSISASRFIIIGSSAQTITNVLFDYLLIFGVGIFPEMGLEGSALASVISEMVYALVVFTLIQRHTLFSEYRLQQLHRPDKPLIKKMFITSMPLMMQYLLSIGAWEVFFIYVEHLGKSESALSQIYRSVFGFVGVAAWALASTCNSMVSNVIGQNALDEVIPLMKKIIRMSFGFALVVGLPMLLFPHFFLRLLTRDAVLVDMGTSSLRIVVLATWMLSVSTILFNGVVGTGKTQLNMIFEFVSIAFYLIYNTLVIEYLRMPLPYAWMSEFVYWFTLFVLSFGYFYKGYWRKGLETA